MTIYTPLVRPTRLYIKQCPHCGLKYFGKSVREDIEKYNGSGVRWNNHLKKHNITPETLWISDWYYDTSITRFAIKFSNLNKIVESNEWANLIEENGINGGDMSSAPGFADGLLKHSRTKCDPEWKNTVGKKQYQRLSETLNDPEWKEKYGKEKAEKIKKTKGEDEWKNTVGADAIEKYKKTTSSRTWKNTIGKQKAEKISKMREDTEEQRKEAYLKTINDPEWKNTVGAEQKRKHKETLRDPDWLKTVGKQKAEKISNILNDPEWIEKNYKTCPHCEKYLSPTAYGRWHGDKCNKKGH